MEISVINSKDSKFEKDSLYEEINAPQWIDLSNHNPSVNDETWFCSPDCNHDKAVEDLFGDTSPSSSKVHKCVSLPDISRSCDRNWRFISVFHFLISLDPVIEIGDATPKNRVFLSNKVSSKGAKFVEDDENQNPIFATPVNEPIIKSTSEKNGFENILLTKEESPVMVKNTLSAHNLFAGKDILNQVSEFCHELKRLATKKKENGEKESAKKAESQSEKTLLLEVKQEKYEGIKSSPIRLEMKHIRSKEEKRLLQIRTNPPSPQCFSANHNATPSNASGLRPQVSGVVEEVESKEEVKKGRRNTRSKNSKQNEGKGMDVFWFFKPCTLSS